MVLVTQDDQVLYFAPPRSPWMWDGVAVCVEEPYDAESIQAGVDFRFEPVEEYQR